MKEASAAEELCLSLQQLYEQIAGDTFIYLLLL